MSPTRRDILKAAGLGAVLAVPAACKAVEPTSTSVVRTYTGVTSFRDDDRSFSMCTVERITITKTGVEHWIGALGEQLDDPDTCVLRSSDHAVIEYMSRMIEAREVHARRLARRRKGEKA